MSTKSLNTMNKFFRILLCLLSVLSIIVVEDSEFRFESGEHRDKTLYVYMVLALMAIYFLQNQLYNYLIPKGLRRTSLNDPDGHYDKSFFKGTIGLGYFLVMFHFIAIIVSANTTHKPEGYVYIGSVLIFFGTLSKIKGIIANELSEQKHEDS